MAATRYDICSGRKDKDGKTRWTKLGAMWPAREGDGFSIKLDALPLPDEKGDVWIKAFVPRDGDGQPAPRQSFGRDKPPAGAPANVDDEIPF